MSWHRWDGRALILELTVQPRASASSFVGPHGDRLRVRVRSPPVDGQANRCLLEFLAASFLTPRSRISLIRGARSRHKTVRIDSPGALPPDLAAALSRQG